MGIQRMLSNDCKMDEGLNDTNKSGHRDKKRKRERGRKGREREEIK
jgi:hypothetical protein